METEMEIDGNLMETEMEIDEKQPVTSSKRLSGCAVPIKHLNVK